MSSTNSAIKIFARLKPLQGTSIPYDILAPSDSLETNEELLRFDFRNMPPAAHFVNHKVEHFTYRYSKIFDQVCDQDEIFKYVAQPVVDKALVGYNGTIFAYGQTGSGKTFTMMGNRVEFHSRGIIPRTLTYVFERFRELEKSSPTIEYTSYVSYLEIYNDCGYDLFHQGVMTGRLDDLGKVSLMEDGSGRMHLRNLSVHPIVSEEEAYQLLYLGDHNRTIAETPMNEESTRSHCIFTIHVSIRDIAASTIKRSKIHLVDLAGSERISNSSISGQLLDEARYINLALHFLEQVIVALGDPNRTHIPYRNSMMTAVLRDSLGGNCLTSMIATMSLETRNFQETISTCRFSQRVALVTNSAISNEELEPEMLIASLRTEIKRLQKIIASSAIKPLDEKDFSPLSPDERTECKVLVDRFLYDESEEAVLPVVPDMRMVQLCFNLLKKKVQANGSSIVPNTTVAAINYPTSSQEPSTQQQIIKSIGNKGKKKLLKTEEHSHDYQSPKLAVTNSITTTTTTFSQTAMSNVNNREDLIRTINNRDNEIKVLVNMLREEKSKKTRGVLLDTSAVSVVIENPNNNYIDVESQEHNISSNTTCIDELFTKGMSHSKKQALENFLKVYSGREALEMVRSNFHEKRSEVATIEELLNQSQSSLETTQQLIRASGQETAEGWKLDTALEGQQRTIDMQQRRLEEIKGEAKDTQGLLKTLYENLLKDFEKWWNENLEDDDNSGTACDENCNQTGTTVLLNTVSDNSGVGDVSTTSDEKKGNSLSHSFRKGNNINSGGSEDGKSKKSVRWVENLVTDQYTSESSKSSARGGIIEQICEDVNNSEFNQFNSPMSTIEVDDDLKGVPLTGDEETDREIISFFRDRRRVMKQLEFKNQNSDGLSSERE